MQQASVRGERVGHVSRTVAIWRSESPLDGVIASGRRGATSSACEGRAYVRDEDPGAGDKDK
jgi:hypothetical protein